MISPPRRSVSLEDTASPRMSVDVADDDLVSARASDDGRDPVGADGVCVCLCLCVCVCVCAVCVVRDECVCVRIRCALE